MSTPRRYELTDFEWSIIQPLLPNKPRGKPRVDDRYGPPTTCANRFRRWAKIGVWDRIFAAVSATYDGDLQMIDASSIRVHMGRTVKRGSAGRRGWGRT